MLTCVYKMAGIQVLFEKQVSFCKEHDLIPLASGASNLQPLKKPCWRDPIHSHCHVDQTMVRTELRLYAFSTAI